MVALISTVLILVFILVAPYSLNAQRDIKDLEREYYELDYKIRQWDMIRKQSGKVVIPENFQQDLARWNQLSAQLAVARAKKAADVSAEENTKNALVELIKHEKTTEYALSAIDGMLQALKAEEEFYKNWEREASLDTGIASTLYGQDRERFQRLKDEAVRRQRELRQQIGSLEQKQNYLNNFKSSVKGILSAKEIHSAVEEGDFFSAAEKTIEMGSDIAERVYDQKTFEEVSGRLEVAKGFLDVGNKIYQGNYLDASISAGNTVDKLLADYQKEYDKENKTLQLFMESDFVDKSLKDKALKVIDIANERKSKIEHLVNFKNKVKYVNERLGKFKKYYGYYKRLTGEIAEYERIASMPGRSETTAKLIYGMSKLGDAFNMIADAMPPMLKETIGQFLNFYADALKLGETIDGIVREWFEKREACLNIYGQNIHNSYALKVIEERWGRDDLCIRPAVEFKQSNLAMYFDDNIGKTYHPIKYFFMPNLSKEPIGLTQEQYSKVVKISSDYSAYASFVESSYRLTNEDLSDIITAVLSDRDSFTINDGYFRDTTFKISQLSRDVQALFHIKASIGEELTVSNHRNMIDYWYMFVDSTEFTERLCRFKLYDNNNIMHRMFVNFLKNSEVFDDFVVRQRLTNPNSYCKIEVSLAGDKETIVNKPATVTASIKNARDTFRYEWLNDHDKSLLSSKESVRVMAGQEGRYPLRFNLYVKSGSREIRLVSLPYVVTVKPDPDMKECVYQYSPWGECSSTTRTQKRTVISKSPAKCVEKTPPVLEQTCIPTVKEPVPCTYQYSQWGACDSQTKRQQRTVVSKSPSDCIEKTPPMLEQSCTPVVKDAPTCSYEYSDWGECVRATKKQTRTVIAKKPDGCVERQKPSLERGCTPPPTEEEKRHQYFNCLCRCSSGWAGHIGVWYDPEEKTKPECKSSGPCIGGIGAFGCSSRHFFIAPNDCAKGCWESAFGKGTYDPDKADKMRREENKKYAKPLTVKLKASKNPADFGDVIDIQALASEGTGGYTYNWSGCTQDEKDYNAKVSFKNECKSCTVSVRVTDQDGNSASDSLQMQCNAIKVKLTKESPKETTVPIGGKATFYAEVFSGDKPFTGPTLTYIWERNPDAIFGDPKNPQYEQRGGSQMRHSATFRKIGTTPVWVVVQREIDGRWKTIGQSEQIPIQVVNPELIIKYTPEKPMIGQEVRLEVSANPKIGDDMVSFWWDIPGYFSGTGDKASIKPKDSKPIKVVAHAKAKDGGDDIGMKEIIITAQGYQVSISEPRYQQSPPQIWQCDTQLGQAQRCGMVTLKPNQFAVHSDIFMKATITPTVDSPRYKWSVEPSGSCGFPGAGSEIKINCSQTGTYTVRVEVINAENIKLGEATQSVTISISQEQINSSKKAKEAHEKIQKAKELVSQGKLDEAINLSQEAVSLDPKNTEAKGLSDKWRQDRDKINEHIKNLTEFIKGKKFPEAEKEISQAKALHPKYAKVIEAEKTLKDAKDRHQKEVTDRLNEAKRLTKEGKIDEAVRIVKEVGQIDKTSAQPVMNEIAQQAKNIGWAALHEGDYKSAIKRLEQSVELNPADSDAQKKLKEAMDYQAKMPQIEAKMREFDQMIADKKIVSSYKKLLEIQDILRTIGASGQSANNPVIIKYNKDYNELNKWYNELTQRTNAEWTRLFQERDWEKAEKLLTEVLRYEHHEANRKNYESSLQMVRTYLNEKKEAAQYYDQAKANNSKGQPSEVKGIDEVIRELNNRISRFKQTEPMYQNIKGLIGELEKRKRGINAIAYATNLFNSGDMYYRAYQFSNAAKQYEEGLKAIRDNGDTKDPLYARYYKLWEESLAKDKRFREIYQYVSAIANTEKAYSEEELNKAIALGEEGLRIVPNSGDLQGQINKIKWKLSELKRQRELQAQCEAKWAEGTSLYNQKRYNEALVKFKENLTCAPNNQERRNYVAQLENTIKQQEAQRQACMNIRKQGDSLVQQKRLKEAIVQYREYLRCNPDRQIEDYIRQLEEIVKKEEEQRQRIEYAKKLRAEGEQLQRANRIQEAIAKYRESLRYLPDPALEKHIRELELAMTRPTPTPQPTPIPTPIYTPPPVTTQKGKVIFENGNTGTVYNNPTRATVFTINQSYVITSIQNYHWNNAKGSTPGTIALRDASGRTYGPWQAKGSPGQGGVPNAYWTVYPNITLSAGTYTVIDSEPSTWSQNSGSQGAGFTRVEGYVVGQSSTGSVPPTPDRSPSVPVQTLIAQVSNNGTQNVHIIVEGQDTFGPHNRLVPGERNSLSFKTNPQAGYIKFIAGRNGQKIAECRFDLGSAVVNENFKPQVTFVEPNELRCTTGWR